MLIKNKLSCFLRSPEDSVGTPAGRVILFGTIPTTIPDTQHQRLLHPLLQTDTPVDTHIDTIIAPTIHIPTNTASLDYSTLHLILESDPSGIHIRP
ncbi:hypothetical protein Tco_0456048 [Tanacetum coccineum]